MYFLNKVEVFKQYRQIVISSENGIYIKSVIQILQRLKIMTMGVVYEKNSEICYG